MFVWVVLIQCVEGKVTQYPNWTCAAHQSSVELEAPNRMTLLRSSATTGDPLSQGRRDFSSDVPIPLVVTRDVKLSSISGNTGISISMLENWTGALWTDKNLWSEIVQCNTGYYGDLDSTIIADGGSITISREECSPHVATLVLNDRNASVSEGNVAIATGMKLSKYLQTRFFKIIVLYQQ